MSRLTRYFFMAFAVAVLLVILAVVATNIYLQGPKMKEKLRQAAMESIGLPLTVRSTSYTPWSGIRLQGLVVPDMENEGVNFLEASEFQITFRLLPLLWREFVVSQLTLKQAVLTWRQNPEGKWRVPRDPKKATAQVAGTPVLPQPSASPALTTEPLPEPPAESGRPFRVTVQNMEVQHSRILFENRDSWPLLDADKIGIQVAIDAQGAAKGNVKVPEAALAGLVIVQDLASPFTLSKEGLLNFSDIRANVSGGTFTGQGQISLREEGSPYTWALNLSALQLQDLRLPAKLGGTQIEGTLGGHLDISGSNAPQRKVRGKGFIEISGGRLIPPPRLQDIGRGFNISELTGMNLQAARADLRMEDDLTYVEPLWLRSDQIAIELRGTVARGGQLKLKGLLLVSPEVAGKLSLIARRELPPANDERVPDYRVIDFDVGGTLQNPESNLLAQILGGGIGAQIGGLLLNFLGTP